MARFRMSPTDRLISDVRANKDDVSTVDFSGQAVFQMKSTVKIRELCEAMTGNTSVTELKLKNCAVNDEGCQIIGAMLEENTSITYLDLAQNSAIKEAGVCSLARSLKKNENVLQLDLMGMAHLGKSEKILRAFIDMYDANITLKKVIWRLDHPLAHTVARLVTRNNSIHRRKSQNKPYLDLLPDSMKNLDGSARQSSLGRAEELVAAAAFQELMVAKQPNFSEEPKSAAEIDPIDECRPIVSSMLCEKPKCIEEPLAGEQPAPAPAAHLETVADIEAPIVEAPISVREQTTSAAEEAPDNSECEVTGDVIAN